MKKIIFFSILFLNFHIIYSQSPSIQWQKPMGGGGNDAFHSICQTSDGGYASVGFTDNNSGDVSGFHGSQDIWLVKSSNLGVIQWQKCLGGTGLERGYEIIQTADGGFAIVGVSYSFDGDLTFNWGGGVYGDYWIIKLTSTGTIQWQKSIGGTSYDEAQSIKQTTDGGYIINGRSYSADGDITFHHGSTMDPDMWVVRLDSNGVIMWQNSLGGISSEEGFSIVQANDGDYLAMGYAQSTWGDVSGNHGGKDYWLVKLNNSGNIVWQKCFGGSANDIGSSIAKTSDNGFVLFGQSGSNDGDATFSNGSFDYWIVKIDSAGNIQWQKSYGGTAEENAFEIVQTKTDHGYFATGHTWSNDGDVNGNHGGTDLWNIKLDSMGNLQWQKSLGGTLNDFGASAQQTTPDGGYIIAGSSFSNDGDVIGDPGYFDSWIIKIDAFSANTTTVDPFCKGGNTGTASVNAIFGTPPYTYLWLPIGATSSTATSLSAGTYTCTITDSIGHFINKTIAINDPLPFIAQPINQTVSQFSNVNFFVIASNPTSTFQWQEDIGTGFIDVTNIGQYSGATNDTLFINSVTLSMNNYEYRCLVLNSLGCIDTTTIATLTVTTGLGIDQNIVSDQILISPNPSADLFYIKNIESESYIEIFDAMGKLTFLTIVEKNFAIINLEKKNKGIYFYRITKPNGALYVGKLILN